ncbi:ArnT family glycosyltransferase [Roseimarinus sediminis]|uniref:ArnT family glycosyltransferase n=1 Tax=Roseimarinus sediminis TaxID=1610899 RepID=UPI003D2604F3
MINNDIDKKKSSLLFLGGLLVFTVLNFFTAGTLGIHFDEAYYWLWSKQPATGYFDHPPMISWLIAIGQLVFKNELGLRLLVIVMASLSMHLLWQMARTYIRQPLLFWALIYSVLLIHPYTFIATPDAPLFFFTVLFFYAYRQVLEKPDIYRIAAIAFASAMLLYSKYHGVLVLGFTLISNLKLLKNKKFWIYAVLLIVLMLPHLFWQIENQFASFRYHLIDSHKTHYRLSVTIEYLLNQLLLTGPWLGWMFLYLLYKEKPGSSWEKALKLTGTGTFVFFLIATFSGDFEAHWTLLAFVPLLLITYRYLASHPALHRWIYIGGGVNFMILLLVRIMVLTPVAPQMKAFRFFYAWDADADMIQEAAGEHPVIFQDNWNKAGRYGWFTGQSQISNLNSALHRRNQFDLWNRDEQLKGQTVVVVSSDSTQFETAQKLETPKMVWYLKTMPNFHSFYDLSFDLLEYTLADGVYSFAVQLNNPYPEKIIFGEDGHRAVFQLYRKNNSRWTLETEHEIETLSLSPNGSQPYSGRFCLPDDWQQSELYLMLRIGELNPIPVKYLLTN